jgi:hypothetical protein
MIAAATLASLGLSACVSPVSDSAICGEIRPLASEAKAALLANADTVVDAVGEPVTRLLVGIDGGC